MPRLPRCDPFPDAVVRDALAAIERGERRRDSRDLPLVVVEIRGDCFSREERTRASRGARHFFEALLQRVSNAHGDGCGARRIHNVLHCITDSVTRHEGSLRVRVGRGAMLFILCEPAHLWNQILPIEDDILQSVLTEMCHEGCHCVAGSEQLVRRHHYICNGCERSIFEIIWCSAVNS
jgi:hypothetical protein